MPLACRRCGSGECFVIDLAAGQLREFIELCEKVTGSDHGLLTNLVVGVIGAFLGGFLASLLGIQLFGFIGALVVATIGAVLFLYVWRMIRG